MPERYEQLEGKKEVWSTGRSERKTRRGYCQQSRTTDHSPKKTLVCKGFTCSLGSDCSRGIRAIYLRGSGHFFPLLLALSALSNLPNQVIKPLNPKDPPLTANKPPAYVLLYIISVLTVFILLYLFVIRQCCCTRKKPPKYPLGVPGMMVLPISDQGGKKPF